MEEELPEIGTIVKSIKVIGDDNAPEMPEEALGADSSQDRIEPTGA